MIAVRRLVAVLPFVSLSFLGACGAPEADEDVELQGGALVVSRGVVLFTSNNWTVPVCFTGGTTAARSAVRDAVNATWGEWTKLSFTGWGECPSNRASPLVPIKFTSTPTVCGGGTTAVGMGARLQTDSTYQINLNYCSSLRQLRSTAVHEMGHAIGLRHEHQRPDRGTAGNICEQQFADAYPGQDLQFEIFGGGVVDYGTVYDPRSIMNYCRDWDRDGTVDLLEESNEDPAWDLSTLDFHAIQQLYGWYDSGFDLPAAAFVFGTNLGTTAAFSDPQRTWHTWGALKPVITRESAGLYRFDLEKFGGSAGNLQVSAFNSANRCKVHDLSTPSGTTTLRVRVRCRTPSGTSADTQFTAKYLRSFEEVGWESAYVYSDQPARTTLYTPTGLYTWNSQGYANTIQRLARGHYLVVFPGQEGVTGDEGTPEVTAVGTGSEHCSILHADDDDDGGQEIEVKCYGNSGATADAPFMLRYGHRSLTGTHSFATVNSINATGTHTPSASNQKSFNVNYCSPAPGPSTITRLGVGRYQVKFTRMWTSSSTENLHGRYNVKVSGWDLTSTGLYCNPMSVTPGLDTLVAVNCYTAGGSPADTRFTASLGTTYNGNCN